MYNSHYFTEFMVRERQRQLIAEADSLHHIKAIKSKKTKNRKRKIGLITGYIRTLEAFLFRKHEQSICECGLSVGP
jgi:hypothetical protein